MTAHRRFVTIAHGVTGGKPLISVLNRVPGATLPAIAIVLFLSGCSGFGGSSDDDDSSGYFVDDWDVYFDGAGTLDGYVVKCAGMKVSNAPPTDSKLKVKNYSPWVKVNGVALATAPAPGSCLSSGFGPRGRKIHVGLDYHHRKGVPVLAAGDGTVRELVHRRRYGRTVLIEHGSGVFTRYAHLARYKKGLNVGDKVNRLEPIGLMGNSGRGIRAIHLHYEVLTGDYNTLAKSFGLTPKNPFKLEPASSSADAVALAKSAKKLSLAEQLSSSGLGL